MACICIQLHRTAAPVIVRDGGGVTQIIGQGRRPRPIMCATPPAIEYGYVGTRSQNNMPFFFIFHTHNCQFKVRGYVLYRYSRLSKCSSAILCAMPASKRRQ